MLRKVAEPIESDYPALKELIENMYQTMYFSEGVGLAAPQIGLSIRLLVIDGSPMAEDYPELDNMKITMINPILTEFSDDEEILEEGCLSITGVHERVQRSKSITDRKSTLLKSSHIQQYRMASPAGNKTIT